MLLIWGIYDGPEGLFQHHPSWAHMIAPPSWAHMIQTLPEFIFYQTIAKKPNTHSLSIKTGPVVRRFFLGNYSPKLAPTVEARVDTHTTVCLSVCLPVSLSLPFLRRWRRKKPPSQWPQPPYTFQSINHGYFQTTSLIHSSDSLE